jgi:hypothetical protein
MKTAADDAIELQDMAAMLYQKKRKVSMSKR